MALFTGQLTAVMLMSFLSLLGSMHKRETPPLPRLGAGSAGRALLGQHTLHTALPLLGQAGGCPTLPHDQASQQHFIHLSSD